MPAYVVAYGKIKDPEKVAKYAEAAGPTVGQYGGKNVMRAEILETLTGSGDYDRMIMLEFPDADAARTWYNSPEYQAQRATRDEGADMFFVLAESEQN